MPVTTQAPVPARGGASDPGRWVELYGDYLFKYALMRLRDATKAEDMVQETFLAALRGSEQFAGRSAEKSWLVGILKHKILDYYRKAGRETSFTDLDFYSDEESDRFISNGVSEGGWIHELGPLEWPSDPGAALDSQTFWKTFHDCSSKLPMNVSTVFTMREVDGIEWRWNLEQLECLDHHWQTNTWISSGFDEPGALRQKRAQGKRDARVMLSPGSAVRSEKGLAPSGNRAYFLRL